MDYISGSGIDYRQCALQMALQWGTGQGKTPLEIVAAAGVFLAFLTRDDGAKEAVNVGYTNTVSGMSNKEHLVSVYQPLFEAMGKK